MTFEEGTFDVVIDKGTLDALIVFFIFTFIRIKKKMFILFFQKINIVWK